MMVSNNVTELALELSNRWSAPVFPCREDKRPLTPRGFHDAIADPVQIKELFNQPSAALIGLPTGQVSGIVVVDLD